MRHLAWIAAFLLVIPTTAEKCVAQSRMDLFEVQPVRQETLMRGVGTFWIRIFQKYVSPHDGKKCGLAPSCSEFARQSFQQQGSLKGWLMTSDRLQRCHPKKHQGFYRIRNGVIVDTPRENLARAKTRYDLFAAGWTSSPGSGKK